MAKIIKFIILLVILFCSFSCTKIEEIQYRQANEAFISYNERISDTTIRRTLWFRYHDDTNLFSVNDGTWCPNITYERSHNTLILNRGDWLLYDIKIVTKSANTTNGIVDVYKRFDWENKWVLVGINSKMQIVN